MADQTPIADVNHKVENASVALDMINEGGIQTPPELIPAPDPNMAPATQVVTLPDPNPPAPVTPAPVATTSQIPAELMAKVNMSTPTVPPPVDGELSIEEINSIKVDDLPEPIRVNFAKMRDKLNGSSKDLASVQAEKDALQARIDSGSVEDPEAFKNLRTMYDNALDEIGKMNLAQDPRFVAKYDSQKAPLVQSIKNAVASYDVEKLNVEELVTRAATLDPRSRMTYLQSQLPEEIQNAAMGVLLPMFSQIDVVDNARAYELEQHKEVSSAYSKTQDEANVAAAVALRESAKTAAVQTVAGEDILLQRIEGNDVWNNRVDMINENINLVFSVDDPSVHAKALVESQLTPVWKEMFVKTERARAAMEATLIARNIALPNLSSTVAPVAPDVPQRAAGQMTAENAASMVTSKLVEGGHLR